ncbi:hypothetical protein DVH24_028017 [Malus domestica]|uniref:F-box domain-containing protein n=1 Tax=Malus domestica TaxID=3750 RepID=A0A498HAL7_MALDO|nr:hypothetical protein DVH24_028017 [Malus domestica]
MCGSTSGVTSASFSSISKSENPVAVLCLPSKPGLGDLLESCAVLILGYLDPSEICKLENLNQAFRSASWADFIWESKLPSNYQTIMGKVFGDGLENLGKRDEAQRDTEVGYLNGDPIIRYQGGVDGFEATAVESDEKIDTTRPCKATWVGKEGAERSRKAKDDLEKQHRWTENERGDQEKQKISFLLLILS